MPTTTVLRGDQLVLRYGKTAVVHGVSVALAPGHVTALVGPNGSGKSTLLRALARLHRVDGGEVTLGAPRRATGARGVAAQRPAVRPRGHAVLPVAARPRTG